MERERFSLLLLEPYEIYFEDFSAIYAPPDISPKSYDTKKQDGRLKMCSKSLVFVPRDISKPIIKIKLKDCTVIEEWKGTVKYFESNNGLAINCKEYVEMLSGNHVAPYEFKGTTNFLFLLNYARALNCLPLILQLQRASTLPAAEQSDMIAAIVYSKHKRIKFDPLWLDLYEKVVIEFQVNRVNPLVVNPGRMLLSTSRLFFQPYNNIEQVPVIKIDLKSICRIVRRRQQLRHIGLEIYTKESGNKPFMYFAFKCQNDRDKFIDCMLVQSEVRLSEPTQNVMTMQWQNGIISNFEYLLYINSLGDRTFNDLTQYPVFPWVLSNYESTELDLNDPKNYRDLTKPVGALNSTRLERLLDRCADMTEPKFLYGSHYSTPGFVLFYLTRLYPHYVLCLQSGRFDHPDRMFNSVADVYRNCLTNMADFKELIPQFYDVDDHCCGDFLVNHLAIDFGRRYNGDRVNNVELPSWCNGPKHFVQILRDALESDWVSQHLHHWIDLIFGYRQRGDEAIKAHNLFYHLCYEGSVDLDAITDLNERHALEVQIQEFGQIPKQVFNVPHPQRISNACMPNAGLDLMLKSELNNIENCDMVSEIDKCCLIHDISLHKGAVRHLFIGCDNTQIVSVGYDCKLKVFSLTEGRQVRSVIIGNVPLSRCVPIPNCDTIAISTYDNQVFIYDLECGKVTMSISAHENAISCLAWGDHIKALVSGSCDGTVKLWKGITVNDVIKPMQCLWKQIDHSASVSSVDFDRRNRLLAIGTEDGEINVWSLGEREENCELWKQYHIAECEKLCSVVFSPDGQKLGVGGAPFLLRVVQVSTGLVVFSHRPMAHVNTLKWTAKLMAVGCQNGTMYLWNMKDVKLLYEWQAHDTGGISTLDVSNTTADLVASASNDGTLRVWKLYR